MKTYKGGFEQGYYDSYGNEKMLPYDTDSYSCGYVDGWNKAIDDRNNGGIYNE